MSIDNFKIANVIEHRSDNPDYFGLRVYLDKDMYIVYYFKDAIHEVYIYDEKYPNYFMGCESDMKTITHYYRNIKENEIKSYRNGKLARVFHFMRDTSSFWVIKDKVKVVYTFEFTNDLPDKNKVYNDLMAFLKEFDRLELRKKMQPIKS